MISKRLLLLTTRTTTRSLLNANKLVFNQNRFFSDDVFKHSNEPIVTKMLTLLEKNDFYKKILKWRDDDTDLTIPGSFKESMSSDELLKVLGKSFNYDDSSEIVNFLDQNGDGMIDVDELNCFISLIRKGDLNAKIDILFSNVDDDDNHFLEFAEFEEKIKCFIRFVVLLHTNPEILIDDIENNEAMYSMIEIGFKHADTNNDGKIEYKEFKKYIKFNDDELAWLIRSCIKFLAK